MSTNPPVKSEEGTPAPAATTPAPATPATPATPTPYSWSAHIPIDPALQQQSQPGTPGVTQPYAKPIPSSFSLNPAPLIFRVISSLRTSLL
ncbi:hypothetical protein K435DRAFT_783296 [Dendrothele bispora CBS 962.96]|uniref:Uncharacterized protein n=1 Tax=Dendrothele bispora (strain CBS 962.96) TaxID=1314807 RepID=A0A4S8LB28_DENBC|nr:hypothetical protein K435DRAFT_783296 [Dendrothele bispora CBS 962.96]